MSYDYASELLTKAPPAAPTAAPTAPQRSYADELLAPRGQAEEAPKTSFSESLRARKAELEGSAGFGALAKAGMVDDQGTKIRILANDLFPGEKDAVERFGMVNGDIVYVGNDDKLYKAEPQGVAGAAKGFAANMLGNAPTVLGGVAGGVAGAGAGPAGAIGLGALGAAGGKGLQEIIANLALDEPQTVGGNVKGMAKEAAFGAAGTGGGLLFQKWLTRNSVRDVGRLNLSSVADLDAKASAQGVDLNVAQRTNLPSLKGRAEALARIPASADDMNAGLERTRQQAADAAERFVASVSPTTGLDEAGAKAVNASKEVIKALTNERSAQARPLYRQAFSEFKEFSEPQLERLAQLRTSPSFKEAERMSTRILKDDLATMAESEMPQAGALRDLHYTKIALDKMIGDAVPGSQAKASRKALIGLKEELLKVMDDASPAYKQARGVFSHLSPNIDSVKDGVISKVADLTDEQAMKASKIMFNPQMSPTAIGRARTLFLRSNLEDDWNSMLDGYLRETLDAAGREVKSGPGAGSAVTWRYMMLGDKKQAANLQAAMSPQQWKGFNDMMDVFDAVGRVRGTGNSITMPMQEAAGELRKESGSGLIAGALQPRQKVIDWIQEARLGKYAQKQVQLLNDPDALRKLNELKRLSPTDEKFIQGFSTLFGVSSSPE